MRPLLSKIAGALVAYGPLGVFLLSLLDSMGVPLPAAMDLLVIGVAAGSVKSAGHAWFTALMAVLGSTGGNIFLFQAARQSGRMWSKGEAEPGKNRRFQQWFRRYGLLTVFVPAVVPVVPLPLKVFVISAGALQAPFGRFLVVIVVARVIRYGGEAWLGLQLGADAAGFLARNGLALTAAALALAGGLYYLMRMAERRHQKENGSK